MRRVFLLHSGRTRERKIMTETQFQNETQNFDFQQNAPAQAENASIEISETCSESVKQTEGQSEKRDPSNNLILGKFKSVEDLTKAYEELQKFQGKNSEELGSLRKELSGYNECKEVMSKLSNYQNSILSVIEHDKELYNTPEYLQNPVFKEIYSEALMTFGDNLDTDRLVGLLEKYVVNRLEAYDKQKTASKETAQVLDSMSYSKNPKNSLTPPKKTLDEMSDDEFKASLRKLI